MSDGQVAAEQRLAARDADPIDADGREGVGDRADLLEGEQRSRAAATRSPASGMQYWQRRLQRSVTEMRRLRSGRPKRSKRHRT